MTDSLGVEIGPGRFRALAATARPLLDPGSAGRRRRRRRRLRRGRPPPAGAPPAGRPADPAPADRRGGPGRPGTGGGRAGGGAEPAGRAARPGARPGRRRRRGRTPGRGPRPVAAPPRADGRAGRGPGPGLRPGQPARRPPAPGRAGGGRRRAVGEPAPDGTASCWPPATWPPTWPGSPPSPTTRWPGWTAARGHRACGSPPSTSARSCPSTCGARSPASSPRPRCPSACPSGWASRPAPPTSSTWAARSTIPDHALLYVAQSLPDRRRPESEPAIHDELEALINAAGGRTLALFTSWRAMHAAVEALSDRLSFPMLSQSDLPKPALVEAFTDSEADLPVRHARVLAGGGRPGPHPQPGDHRPDPVPPTRRPGAAGPARPGRGRGLRRRRPAPGRAPCWPRVRAG